MATSPNTSAGSGFRAWHAAGILLVLTVGGLLVYGLWPQLTGGAADEAEREPTVEAAASAAQVTAVVARRTDFPLRTEATGRLAPWRRAQISSEADGLIAARRVEEGQYVDEGTVLLRLRADDEQIALDEARAALIQAQVDYAVNAMDGTAADTATVLERAEAALQQMQANAASGRLSPATVRAASTGLMEAIQRVKRAELALARTQVRAPFAGRVANIQVEEGQRLTPGQVVCTLLDDRPMKVEVDVLEADLPQMREGATARVAVPALATGSEAAPVIEGRVHAINPMVDPAQGTARVTVALPNPDGRLVAGLFANVRLETARLQDRLVVPADAVLVRQGRDLVFVMSDGRAQWTYVEVGARSGDVVEITSGIQPGDTVAVDGHYALAHDAPVEVTGVQALAVP